MRRLDKYSQNFLRNPRLVLELIGHSNIKKSDTVFDIGAGSGVISACLAKRAGSVISYEVDPRMVAKLHDNLVKFENVTVIGRDFMEAELPSSPYKIFANIPFHLSSPIIKKLTESPRRPEAIYLIVQKQFAEKLLIDTDKFTGLLGAQIAPIYTAKIRKRLERGDFWPRPAVDTAFIELILRDKPLVPEDKLINYREFVDKCFSRQKYFATLGLGNKRPSELSTAEWLGLFTKR